MHWWIFYIPPLRAWRYRIRTWRENTGLFENLPHIVPGRWGVTTPLLEIGNRNPGSPFGQWLKRVGLWPW